MMRKHLMNRVAEEIDLTPDTNEDIAHSLVVDAFGPRSAAWLVKRHRRQLHLTGRVKFEEKTTVLKRFTPPGRKLFWFELAIALLKQRPGWSVTKTEHRGKTTFELRWLNWLSRSRGSTPNAMKDIREGIKFLLRDRQEFASLHEASVKRPRER